MSNRLTEYHEGVAVIKGKRYKEAAEKLALFEIKLPELIEELRWEHPYKQIGDPDTYCQYNEAWQDCLDRVESILEGFERQLKGGGSDE